MRTTRPLLIAPLAALLCTFALAAGAQEKIDDSDATGPARIDRIAIVPWTYMKCGKGAEKAVKDLMGALMTHAGVEVIPEVRTIAALGGFQGDDSGDAAAALPTPRQLLHLGKALDVDYVMAGRATWHTRSIWIGLGPKTKSDCTVDALIIDVKQKEIALNARGIHMDDTAHEDTLKALGTVFVSSLFTVVSGGPKTPHEERAGELAVTKALEPWIVQRTTKIHIDTGPDSKQ